MQGMISGVVMRVEDKSALAGQPAALVTVAGETPLNLGNTAFVENVRLTGSAATRALGLKSGQAVVFDPARIEQQTWTDEVSGTKHSQTVIRAGDFTCILQPRTKRRDYVLLEDALNMFTLRGRLVADARIREHPSKWRRTPWFAEATLAVNPPGSHVQYFKILGRESRHLANAKKGQLAVLHALVRTESTVTGGVRRSFTTLHELQFVVLK